MKPRNALLWTSSAVISLLCLTAQFSSALELTENGGYKIVIAVEEDAEIPEGTTIPEYIRKMEGALRSFTQILFTATEKFHLASVELVLPRSWPTGTPGVEDASAAHGVASSDIRLSEAGTFPYVENPHACALPGQYIQLPVDFFQPGNTLDGRFGSPAKVLLTQWARFRWGVWEEHGYPGDSKFPYFYHGTNGEGWVANSCSNDQVHGNFENIATAATCDQTQADPLDPNCRFKPDIRGGNNHVRSSLMTYPWLEVVRFCDSDTHKKAPPNRQNTFCNYQSVMEVIRQTPDYAGVTIPQDSEVPSLTFKTFQHKAAPEVTKPALFILLDKGYRELHATNALNLLMTQLGKMLLGDVWEKPPLPEEIVVSTGVFPDGNNVMSTTLTWASLDGARQEELWDFFASAAEGSTSYTRNFVEAIAEVTRKVQVLSPENGAMILLVKTGAPGNSYFETSTTYEVEVETALKQHNIKLYAVEITDGRPGSVATHLHGLATRSSGTHADLVEDDAENAEKAAEIVALGINDALGSSDSAQKILVVHKGSISLNTVDPEPKQVLLKRRSRVTVTLVAPYNPAARLEIVGLPTGVNYPGPVRPASNEWGVQSRQNHFFAFDYTSDGITTINVTYTCAQAGACAADKSAFLYVTETITGDQDELPEIAKVKVTVASRPESRIEFTPTTAPYAVSVKVEYGGKPVGNAKVTATATYDEPATEVVFELLDDGKGYPDGAQLDGIYSAHFVPPVDGRYEFKVDVTRSIPDTPTSRLLPIDQDEFGCVGSCDAVDFPETEDLEIREIQLPAVVFANVEAYPGRGQPEKVMDFVVRRNAALTGVDFTFTSPALIGNSTAKAAKYGVFAASTPEALLPRPPQSAELRNYTTTQNPGEAEQLGETTIDIRFLYFGIIAYADDEKESPIFISRIDFQAEEDDSTSPTPGSPDPSSPTPPGSTTTPPGGSPTPGGSTPPSEPEDDKPFFETPGGIVVIILIVLIIVGGAGGAGFWYWKKKQSARGRTSSHA